MKQVNSEITAMGLATSWIEIFNFRECHIGDSSQTVKGLALHIQSRHMKKVQGNFVNTFCFETMNSNIFLFIFVCVIAYVFRKLRFISTDASTSSPCTTTAAATTYYV